MKPCCWAMAVVAASSANRWLTDKAMTFGHVSVSVKGRVALTSEVKRSARPTGTALGRNVNVHKLKPSGS